MGVLDCTLVLRVELHTYIKRMPFQLNDLHKVSLWVCTYRHQAAVLKNIEKFIIKLIAMAVALLDIGTAIYFCRKRPFPYRAVIAA